ncbi:MAG TPA: hypothetical protein VF364_00420 [Candidatus Limnocylindria bacterium]
MELPEWVTKVGNVWALVGLCVFAAIPLTVAGWPFLGGVALFVALAVLAFAALTGDHGSNQSSGDPSPDATGAEPEDSVAPYPVEQPRGGAQPTGTPSADFHEVVYRHLTSDQPNFLGEDDQTSVRFFVNLRRAALQHGQLEVLVDELEGLIRRSVAYLDNWDILAGPKSGNAALVLATAERLGLKPMFVRDRKLNGQYVECARTSGRVLLVDDVASDAHLLLPTAVRIRQAGYVCTNAFLLIRRGEGTLGDRLGGEGTDLRPPISVAAEHVMSDEDFARLVRSMEAARES